MTHVRAWTSAVRVVSKKSAISPMYSPSSRCLMTFRSSLRGSRTATRPIRPMNPIQSPTSPFLIMRSPGK